MQGCAAARRRHQAITAQTTYSARVVRAGEKSTRRRHRTAPITHQNEAKAHTELRGPAAWVAALFHWVSTPRIYLDRIDGELLA